MNVGSRSTTLTRMALVAALVLGTAPLSLAQVTITKAADQVSVDIDGKPFTVFHTGGENLNRVYLHPLRAATGTVVNRSFPAGQVPGETVDHPHHAGLFYGHGDVNGINFWSIQNVKRAPASPAASEQRTLPAASAATPTAMPAQA